MANNEYPYYEQQQGWPPYNGNGPRNNQRGWQDGAQNGGYNNQHNPRPHHNGYSEQNLQQRYGDGGYPQQRQQWDDGSYQAPYQPEYDGHQHSDKRDQYPGPDRSYHYDERFQSQGHGRPAAQPSYPTADAGRRPDDRRQPAPMNLEKKPKPRERILTEPVSPKIAWDSPFPTFNPKKKEEKKEERKKHSSLDRDLNRLDLDGSRLPTSRSQTSQGHRTRDESRPHTAHSQRPPDAAPPPGPFLQEQSTMSPLKKGPFRVNTDPDHQRMEVRHRPQFPTDWSNPAVAPDASQEERDIRGRHPAAKRPTQDEYGKPVMQRPLPLQNRSTSDSSLPRAPKPTPAVATAARQQQPAPSQTYNRTAAHDNGYHAPNQQWQQPEDTRRHGPRQASEPIHQSSEVNAHPFPPMNRRAYLDDMRITTSQSAPREMPNFDSIPMSGHEKEEVHIETGQPAYQKKPYQAPGSFATPTDTRMMRNNPQQQAANDQPLAGFEFELPSYNPSIPPAERARTQPYTNAYTSPVEGEKPVNPYQNRDDGVSRPKVWDQQVQPGSNGQHPPRSASRADTQPHSAIDTRQYPLVSAAPVQQPSRRYQEQGMPGYEQLSQPKTRQQPYNSDPNNGPQYDIGDYEDAADYGYQSQQYPIQQCPPDDRGPRATPGPLNGHARYPGQYPAEAGSFSTPSLRPQPSISMQPRPPPVRHYGERSASDSMARPPQGGFNTSPDALPAHPVPVRPGQMGNNQLEANSPSQAPSIQSTNSSGQQAPRPAGNQKTPEKPVTLAELNSLQVAMKNDPQDHATGLRLAKRLVQAASVLSNEGGRADPKTTAKNREKYIFDAHKIVKKLVNAGYPEAMFYLADCHGQGLLGLAVDPREAFALYQSAAKLNHPQSAYRVAVCCEIGQDEGGGTRRDPVKSVQWYRRAATLGDTPAMYKMGMVLLKGLLGQQKNPREALSWLKRAAERADEDNPHALHELGLLYESAQPTDHIIRDEKYALQLFHQAAELGYKYSQFRLGSAYEYGLLGCTIDARQSIAWYSAAATQGEHQSELALSGWYLTGSPPILDQSDTEAYLWARKAAKSGLAKAEYAMGYFTEVGIGASANIEEAKRWYWKAAAQNLPRARERLEDLKKGGQKMQKTRVSRSAVGKQNEGECTVM